MNFMKLDLLPKLIKSAFLFLVFSSFFSSASAQYILGPEGFENAFPPAGWTITGITGTNNDASGCFWSQANTTAALCGVGSPSPAVVHAGAHSAGFESYWIGSGGTASLVSPSLNLSNTGGLYQLQFWVYNYSTACSFDSVQVFINTAPSAGGALIGRLITDYSSYSTAFTNYSTSTGWFKCVITLPAAYCTSNSYIIFNGSSLYGCGDNFIDDVSVIYIAPCSGQPMAPTIASGPTTPLCSGGSATLTGFDPNTAGSLYNVWQQSPTGAAGTWTNVPNSNSATFTTPALGATMYYRFGDSCGISHLTNYSPAYTVQVNTYAIPYAENFNTTLNTYIPYCFTENITTSGQSRWQVNTVFRDASGVAYPAVMDEEDPPGNFTNGKNAFFSIPALVMNAGETYRIRFGYERGRSDYLTTNVAPTFAENLQLFENFAVQPSIAAQGSPGGTNLFNTSVTVDGHNTASLTFTPSTTGIYFFSWYSNTPHPSGGASQAGGVIAVDSIKIDSFGCNLPVITFQPQNAAVCVGSNATISVTATGYGLSYQWFKAGSTTPLTNVGNISGATTNSLLISNAQASDASTYKVVVTGTCGGVTTVSSNTVTLGVSNYPTDTVTTTTPTTFCAGGSVVLTANTQTGNSYQWKLNGNLIPGVFTPTYTATIGGIYTGVATNTTGCAATSPGVVVTVLSASGITISPSGPTTFCNGGSVTLTSNTIAGVRYTWLLNGVPVVPANHTNVLTTSTAGTYTIVDTGANNCVAQFPGGIPVVVNGPTSAPSLSATGPLSFCLGGFVSLTTPTPTQSGYTFQWYQNNNAIAGATGTSYTASASGAYKVNVSQNNCALSSIIDTVKVDAPPTTISSNGTIICSGNTIVLSAPACTGCSYQWLNNGNPVTPAATGQIFTTTTGGNFQVSVTDTYPCTSVSSVVPVSVGAPPSAVIQAAGPTTFCPGGSVVINANVDTSLNYIWITSPTGLPGSYTALTPLLPNGHHDYSRTFSNSAFVKVVESNGPCIDTTSFAIQVIVSPVPSPSITPSGSTSLCPGGSVTLNTQTGTGLTYQWYNNGVLVPGAITPSYVVNVATAGTIKVIATNSVGCTGASLPVMVTTNPLPVVNVLSQTRDSICAGSSVTLIASQAAGNQYQWNFNGVPIVGDTMATLTASPGGTSGTYHYSVTTTSSAGCVATSAATNVVVFPVPNTNIFASSSTTFCAGNSVVLSAGSGAGLTYQWQTISGGNYYNIPNATHISDTVTTAGNYRVAISSGICAVASVVVPVTVTTAPAISITPTGNTTVCKGTTVTLTATSLPGVNYQWQDNNSNIGNSSNAPTYTASVSGSYTVVASGNNCISTSAPIVVTVNNAPTDSVASISVRAHITCTGTPDTLVDVYAFPGFSYQWNINGAALPGQTNPYIFALDSGLYTVTATDTNYCTGTSAQFYVGLLPLPNPLVTNVPPVLSTGTFLTYQWYFNDNKVPGANTNSIVVAHSGKYKVLVTDGNGCSNMSADSYVVGVGVNSVINKDEVKIYPNPATSIVHIDAPAKVNVTLSGLDGRVILQGKGVTQIDLTGLASGVYMINVYDENDNIIKVDKLVKAGW